MHVFSVTNFHPDTRGQRWSLIWTHLSSCIVGREGLCTQISLMCGECSQCMDCIGFAPLMAACAFQVYTAQAPGCSAGALSKADPASRALPRSKLLGFLGTPLGHRLCWVCVLCPSQVRGAQATRCLVSALSQVGRVSSSPSCPAARFAGCAVRAPSQVCCVSPLGS